MSHRDLSPTSASATPESRKPRPALSPEGFREDAHAVVIGINHYDDPRIPDLRFAVADAQRFHDVLTDPTLGRFRPDNVCLLLDGDATERRIRSAIGTDLPKRASADHTVCVFFAGHGAPVINARTGSSDGLEKYLLPHDALANDLRSSAIPMDDVNKFFDWIDTSQVIFFIDSCYSGVAGGRTFGPADYAMRAAVTDEFLDSLGGEGRLVVTACATNEVALEREDIGHGLFTFHLIEGLKGHADANQDGLVTLDELYDYVYHKVERQARTMGGSMNPLRKGFVKGSVYLAQYETPSARRVRTALASAEVAFGQGDLDAAERLWRDVVEIDSGHDTARRGLETIEQRRADEKAELDRLARVRADTLRQRQRVLLEHRKAGSLSIALFASGMEVIAKDHEHLDATDRMLRDFTDALIDGELNVVQYVRSVELLLGDVATDSDALRAPSTPIAAGTPDDANALSTRTASGIAEESSWPDASGARPSIRPDETATEPSSAATADVSDPSKPAATTPTVETQASSPMPERIDASAPHSELASSETSRDSFIGSPAQPPGRVVQPRPAFFLPMVEAAAGLAVLAFAGVTLQQNGRGPATASLLPEHVAVVEIALAANSGDNAAPTVVAPALTDLEAAIRALPGLASAAVSSVSPLGNTGRIPIEVGGPVAWSTIQARRVVVTSDYFEALGVPLVSGRSFDPSDASPRALVALVNERMADGLWPGTDPLGQTLRYAPGTVGDVNASGPSTAELTIIGVVGNERLGDGGSSDPAGAPASSSAEWTFYVPYGQTTVRNPHYVVIRSAPSSDGFDREGAGSLASAVRGAIEKAIPGANVVSWTSAEDGRIDRAMIGLVLLAILGLVGAIALLHGARTVAFLWKQHRHAVAR